MSFLPRRESTGNFWHDHSLSIFLIVVFLVETLWAFVGGYYLYFPSEAKMQAAILHQPLDMSWLAWIKDFWGYEAPLSMMAEPHGLFLMVVATVFWWEKGSAESGGHGEKRQKRKESQ